MTQDEIIRVEDLYDSGLAPKQPIALVRGDLRLLPRDRPAEG